MNGVLEIGGKVTSFQQTDKNKESGLRWLMEGILLRNKL